MKAELIKGVYNVTLRRLTDPLEGECGLTYPSVP